MRLPKRRANVPIVLAATMIACSGSVVTPEPAHPPATPVPVPVPVVERDTTASFQTDSLLYTLRADAIGYMGTIAATFTHRTGRTAYVVNCNGGTLLALERLVDGQWRTAWRPEIPACLSAPIVIASGATHQTQIGVFGGYPGSNIYPQFDVRDPTGVYRAVWFSVLSSYQERAPFGDPLPFESRVSNPFVLTIERR
jgi:hypothetical protein